MLWECGTLLISNVKHCLNNSIKYLKLKINNKFNNTYLNSILFLGKKYEYEV